MPIPRDMAIPAELLVFAGSLLAILMLAGLAHLLKLGPLPALSDPKAAARAANEIDVGFSARDIALDAEGRGALLRSEDGRFMVIRRHGAKFVGRLLEEGASARIEDGMIIVDNREKRFGEVRLDLADPSAWVQAINAIEAR